MSQKTFDLVQLAAAVICTLVIFYLSFAEYTGLNRIVFLGFALVYAKAVKKLLAEYKTNHSKVS